MIRFFVGIVCVAIISSAAAREPLLIVLERNPWLMVIGSDSPTFALYDDGTVIFLREEPTPEDAFRVRKVTDAKRLAEDLLSFDVANTNSRYELSAWSDQVTTIVWTPSKRIEIYGNWRHPPKAITTIVGDPRSKEFDEREEKLWRSLPSRIRGSLRRIDEQRKQVGSGWLPERIEVMFWPYENAPDESIVWPNKWPGLSATDTMERNPGDYTVFLPVRFFSELREFLATERPRGAVLIDDKKMAVSYRIPFPREALWMK